MTPACSPARNGAGLSIDRALSRRALLGALTGAMAARPAPASPPTAIGDPDPSALLPRLVNRITFGLTDYELTIARGRGYRGYLEYHLAHTAIQDMGMASVLAPYTTLNMTPAQLFDLPPGQVVNELIDATLMRAWYSRRQLFERMVEFWSDHFNIDINNGNGRWLKTPDDRDVIRPYTLTTFPELLRASASSPAMMFFLDNHLSMAAAPNENYARELMELHTMGVDGGYTQQDVREVARCLTGWGLYPNNAGASLAGTFRYNPADHDNGEKRVLGHVIPAGGGQQDGLTVLGILSGHPSTARFIARKLCVRFLGYDPPAGVVKSVAGVYAATGGDIRAMLRKVLAPEHLADAAPKYKRPLHAYISALRASGSSIASPGLLRAQLQLAGHLPFNWGPPDGYPDSIEFWSGLVLPRWNFGAQLTNGNFSGITFNVANLFAGLTTADQIAAAINALFFGGEMPPTDLARVRGYLLPDPPTTPRQKEAVALAIGCPGFQWY